MYTAVHHRNEVDMSRRAKKISANRVAANERHEIVELLRSPGIRTALAVHGENGQEIGGDGLARNRPFSQKRSDAVLKASINALRK